MQGNRAGQNQRNRRNPVALKFQNCFLVPNCLVKATDQEYQRETDASHEHQNGGNCVGDRHFNRLNVEDSDFSDILAPEAIKATKSLSYIE